MNRRITLIIVDCQYDFIDGSLAVNGAHIAIDNIIAFILDHKDNIDKIIFTLDWHPINHCSFKNNGGTWPPHCVQYTKGAGIDFNLYECVYHTGIPYDVILKGSNAAIEEYGAFSIHPLSDTLFDDFHSCHIDTNSDIVVCGIAGDYCVKETIKNILPLEPKVFLKGIASIDDGTTIKNFIKACELKAVLQ